MNKIIKDNRIPPQGFNKAAYQADGAFIIPADAYANGQNWDTTAYIFSVPGSAREKLLVCAILYYQTFNREYAEFLREHDHEPTVSDGGRARDIPAQFRSANPEIRTWGQTLHALWQDAGQGPPVFMGSDEAEIKIRRSRR